VNDAELIARFEDGSLAGQEFHHVEHVRVAYLYLCRYPVLEALHRFSTSLMNFAARMGAPERYNETITWAFLFLIRDRMARTGGKPSWIEFEANNQDLLNWQDHVLKKYYNTETLSSDLARRTFLFPDKASSESA
jgi:hypothetical protein